jgi:hypothetical protein
MPHYTMINIVKHTLRSQNCTKLFNNASRLGVKRLKTWLSVKKLGLDMLLRAVVRDLNGLHQ